MLAAFAGRDRSRRAADRALRLGVSGRGAFNGAAAKVAASFLSQIAATKAFLEQKFHLRVECVAQGLGYPRWRDDDLTSNVFGSDARVDTLTRRVSSRGSTS
jgi:hypothetical protein